MDNALLQKIQKEFPILQKKVRNNKRLVYLDNAATTQKPKVMMEALTAYYEDMNANIHRGVHHLSEYATQRYEETRLLVKNFINAPTEKECIFVRSTTEAINLVANAFGSQFLKADDEILISAMEHHSNIVPWQLLCDRLGTRLKVIPINEAGEIDLTTFENYFTPKTKLLSICHVSNALGTLNPIQKIIQIAKRNNVPTFIDGAQSIPHLKIDVQALGCDFFAFSGHKLYGPTGIGVLYGKSKWLEQMPPYQGGGEMILSVSFEKSLYQEIPYKFEAGTPPIAEVIGLGASLQYLNALPWQTIVDHEKALVDYATICLAETKGVRIVGTATEKLGVISFTLANIHPHDIGTLLDEEGVAIRTGHHCAMPLMDFFKIPGTARISFGVYNTKEEVDVFIKALHRVKQVFKC